MKCSCGKDTPCQAKLSDAAYLQGLEPMLKHIKREEAEAEAQHEADQKAKRHAAYLARKTPEVNTDIPSQEYLDIPATKPTE